MLFLYLQELFISSKVNTAITIDHCNSKLKSNLAENDGNIRSGPRPCVR